MIFKMAEKCEDIQLKSLGEQLEMLHRFDNTLIPYIVLLGKMTALRNLIPTLQDHISEEDIHRVILLMEMLQVCSEIIEEPVQK